MAPERNMKKADVDLVVRPLPEFSNVQVISYLVSTHHEFTRNIMEEISELIAEAQKELLQPPGELGELAEFWRGYQRDMLKHLEDEENILFPWIEKVTQSGKTPKDISAEFSGPIAHMSDDHDHHEAEMERVRELAQALSVMGGYVPVLAQLAYKLKQLDHDMREHMEIETKLLFPRILGVPA